ncbi:hypothetical protein EHS25_003946 [Saitozyma podzolica]|uniref:Uncharacterized protein n=1 Tax=Saitozyma podzolica TaxID=1890683 RepID=A0A427YSM9_9TREE|nr:hypothetical protein EHS25_003946 [Saitozyma podzolica]
MSDWDADYDMGGGKGEVLDPSNLRSTTADNSHQEVSHPRTLRSTTARWARSDMTDTPPTSSPPPPSATYVPSVSPECTPPPPSIPPPDSPWTALLSLGDLTTMQAVTFEFMLVPDRLT